VTGIGAVVGPSCALRPGNSGAERTPRMLRTDALDYELPEDLIATTPAEPRDAARLMVLSRSDPGRLEHRAVRDLPEVLRPRERRSTMPPDLMVVNATRVLAARFTGVRVDTGGHVEGLYVRPGSAPAGESSAGPVWVVLLKMRRMKPGVLVALHDRHGRESGVRLRLLERDAGDPGAWAVAVESERLALSPAMTAPDLLEWVGLTPLPPYILAARRRTRASVAEEADRSRYQTVYATDRGERPGHGSVAAPTAGLHFTAPLLEALREAGVERAEVTLDVGLGTFKPVETEHVEEHPMHAEWCSVPGATAGAVARIHGPDPARRGRVIAVGTTAARTLESFESVGAMLRDRAHETRILITPGYRWRHVDGLLTNFHLPRSTLLAMVASLLMREGDDPMEGVRRLLGAYAVAVREGYRFYSYGDAMVILP
jgi:S-adenosylmethionine:tRNA ribosyltransferase-isomerase